MKHTTKNGGALTRLAAAARPPILSHEGHEAQRLLAQMLTFANTGVQPDRRAWSYAKAQQFVPHRRSHG